MYTSLILVFVCCLIAIDSIECGGDRKVIGLTFKDPLFARRIPTEKKGSVNSFGLSNKEDPLCAKQTRVGKFGADASPFKLLEAKGQHDETGGLHTGNPFGLSKENDPLCAKHTRVGKLGADASPFKMLEAKGQHD